MKKILVFFLLFLSLFLVSCGKSNKSDKKVVKFSNYEFVLPSDFMVYPVTKKDLKLKDYSVLSAYKYKKSHNGFSPSLLILRYDGKYPSDEEKFFSIMLDKMKREIVGVDIFEKGEDKVKGKKIYYFKYKVNDNMFDNSNLNIYYGFYFYVFDKPNIYIISYLSLDKKDLNNIFKLVKNLNYNN